MKVLVELDLPDAPTAEGFKPMLMECIKCDVGAAFQMMLAESPACSLSSFEVLEVHEAN